MSWRVDEPDPMFRVFEVPAPCLHRLQNPLLSLDPQVVIEAAPLSHETDQRFGFVRVQLVQNKDPTGLRIVVDGPRDVRDEVLLGPSRADGRQDGLPGRDHEVRYEAQGAMADVFELNSLSQIGPGGLRRMESFTCLDPRLLVDADHVRPRLEQGRRIRVSFRDLLYVGVELFRRFKLVLGRQPILALVGPDRVFFRNRSI